LLATLTVALLVALVPFSILAAGPTFSDLDQAAAVHQPNIQLIGDAGITTGSEDPNDPTKRLYKPKDNVTREEMATFLARTAGLGTNPPVVNAAKVGGKAPGEIVRTVGARGNNVAFGGAYTPIASVAIEVPAPGYVIAIGSATMNVPNNGGACPCEALVRLSGPNNAFSLNANLYSTTIAVSDSTSTNAIFAVQPGTVTIQLQMQRINGTVALTGNSDLSLLYVPFGAGGVAP
jgi:hypothetical protein